MLRLFVAVLSIYFDITPLAITLRHLPFDILDKQYEIDCTTIYMYLNIQ